MWQMTLFPFVYVADCTDGIQTVVSSSYEVKKKQPLQLFWDLSSLQQHKQRRVQEDSTVDP